MSRPFASVVLLLGVLCVPSMARADLVSPTPPDCVDRPDGTACIRGDGTAGVCLGSPDGRRPGRVNVTCAADAHECDRLPIGAECHGYLHRPSHCREFTNAARPDHWRACVADDTAPGDAASEPRGPSAPATPAATPTPATRPDAAASHCAVSRTHSRRSPDGIALALGAVLLGSLLRRRRRTANFGPSVPRAR
ncbi:MAG: hypothetical protein WCJ30_18590 [Deltaproteobacteria bacterium]